MANEKGLIESIGDNLSRVFRHILPGMFILSISYLAKREEWFNSFDVNNTYHLIILAAIAILVGNSVYVINRYIVVQLIDCILVNRIIRKRYSVWFVEHVIEMMNDEVKTERMRDHIFFRVSQIFYLQIMAETLMVFPFMFDNNSIFLLPLIWKWIVLCFGLFVFIFSIWQIWLLFKLEEKLKENKLVVLSQ